MRKLNIKRFATANPDTFEMYTRHTENYDTFGNCISVTISTVASLDIIQITKNGVDVSNEWSGIPGPNATKTYTSNITETLTFYGSNGQEYVETIDITSVETNPVIPPEFYASNANIKINSDVKIGKMSLKEIDDTVSTLFDLIYPVGSIYYTNNANFSPNVSFNGTWEQIKDVFLLAAGDIYVGGTSGGTANVQLTEGQLPKHRHYFQYSQLSARYSDSVNGANNNQDFSNLDDEGHSIAAVWCNNGHERKGLDSITGNNEAHNNMPPYIVVYVWKRVS